MTMNYYNSTGDDFDFAGDENPMVGTEVDNFSKYESVNPIWDYFLRHMNGEKAKCMKCDRIVSIKGGNTRTMRAHMRLVHKTDVAAKSTYVNSHVF